MNLKKIQSFFLVALFFILVLFFIKDNNFFIENNLNTIKYVDIAGVVVKVDLAITPREQEKGLSIKNNLENNEGMLFLFKRSSVHYFWMKGMNFPIDIVWIDKDMKVIYIEKNIEINTYPQAFGVNKESKYVLEVNAGFAEKNNWKENDTVIFLF